VLLILKDLKGCQAGRVHCQVAIQADFRDGSEAHKGATAAITAAAAIVSPVASASGSGSCQSMGWRLQAALAGQHCQQGPRRAHLLLC
jgi:hypothetical protein